MCSSWKRTARRTTSRGQQQTLSTNGPPEGRPRLKNLDVAAATSVQREPTLSNAAVSIDTSPRMPATHISLDTAHTTVVAGPSWVAFQTIDHTRSEEHTSELQSRGHLVCRLLL